MSFTRRVKTFVVDSITGKRSDWKSRAALPGLSVLSGVYRGVVGARSALYGAGLLEKGAPPVPVISVGNITSGGTGKTPLVESIVGGLLDRGRKPAILSRGYGPPVREGEGPRSGVSDESLVLADNLPDVPLVLGADRLFAARRAIADFEADVLVCDDAFQHLRLRRDLDVVAIDATLPFGFGHVLPRGLLREPLDGLSRAGIFVVTRADLIEPDDLDRLIGKLQGYAPEAPVCQSTHSPVALRGHLVDNDKPLDYLRGRRVAAFSAVGNPYAFGMTLRRLGAKVIYARRFEDHHVFGEAELAEIGEEAVKRDAELVVVTQKDAVKIKRDPGWPIPVYYLAVELEITKGEADLWSSIEAALEKGDERGREVRAREEVAAADEAEAGAAADESDPEDE